MTLKRPKSQVLRAVGKLEFNQPLSHHTAMSWKSWDEFSAWSLIYFGKADFVIYSISFMINVYSVPWILTCGMTLYLPQKGEPCSKVMRTFTFPSNACSRDVTDSNPSLRLPMWSFVWEENVSVKGCLFFFCTPISCSKRFKYVKIGN